jgi:hypothetical protein
VKLSDLETEWERKRVITYNVDQTKAVYHARWMQQIGGNLYRGETEKRRGASYDVCDLYICYPGKSAGMWVAQVDTSEDTVIVMEKISMYQMDTAEQFLQTIQRKLLNDEYFRYIEIEMIKTLAPELENPMWESRKRYAEQLLGEREERRKQQEEADRQYVDEKNTAAQEIVETSLQIIRSGGELRNSHVDFYRSRYDHTETTVVLYLMKKYGIACPIRTQGWIGEKLGTVSIHDGKVSEVRFYKTGRSTCSQKFFDCMNDLIEAVNREADKVG